MSVESDEAAESGSGTFSVANVTSFLTSWWGRGGDTPVAVPAPTTEQVAEAEETEKAMSSWGIPGLNLSYMNMLDIITFPLSLLPMDFDIYGFRDEDDEGLPSLHVDGYQKKDKDTGAELVVQNIAADGISVAAFSLIVFQRGVITIDTLSVGSISFKNELIDVTASITLTDIEVKADASTLIGAVGSAFAAVMSNAADYLYDAYYDVLEGDRPDVSGILADTRSVAGVQIAEYLKVKFGAHVGRVAVTAQFAKFGLSNEKPVDTGITAAQAGMAKHAHYLKELDLTLGEVVIETDFAESAAGTGGYGGVRVSDTQVKVGQDGAGQPVIEGGTRVDLGGQGKARVGDLLALVDVIAQAEVDVQATFLAVDTLTVSVDVSGTYADEPVALQLSLLMVQVGLGLSCDKGAVLDCIARESVQAIDFVLKFIVGDGEPTGLTPQQLKATFVTAVVVQLRDALLKDMKLRLDARVGQFSANVQKFQYGDFSGEADIEVNDVDFSAVLDPEDPVQMSLSADVLMSGVLQAKDQNLLDFEELKIDLDDYGNGKITGHFALHSAGLEEVLGSVLGKASKTISKQADINIDIANYVVALSSTDVSMSSKLLNPLVSFVLNHVGVKGGVNPGLGLTAKVLRKTRIKKVLRSDDLGKDQDSDTADILIDGKTAQAIFGTGAATGGVNLIGFLQNTVQTRLDALRDWEPPDPTADPEPEPVRAEPTPPASPLEIPATTSKQLKAVKALRKARIKLRDASRAVEEDPSDQKRAAKVTKAEEGVDGAEKALIEVNMQTVEKARKDMDKAARKEALKAVKAAKSAQQQSGPAPTDQDALYRMEVEAAQSLLVNNCLIDAIAGAAGVGAPDIAQLTTIRSELGNVGEMMIASPNTVDAVLRGLGLAGRKVIVTYPPPISAEIIPGRDPAIWIRHTGAAHFVADNQ